MTDFPRWSETELPPRLRTMFDVARAEAPDVSVLARSLVAVAAAGVVTTAASHAVAGTAVASGGAAVAAEGASVTAGGATGAATWAASTGGIAAVKWGIIGFAGSLAAMGAVAGAHHLAQAPERAPVAASAPHRAAPPAARPASPSALDLGPVASARAPTAPSLARPAAPTGAPDDTPTELALEIGMIERARSALRAGRWQVAIAEAQAYTRRFAGGQFEPEMAYITMEALERMGDRAGAERAARDLVARHPSGPQLLRAHQILEREKE